MERGGRRHGDHCRTRRSDDGGQPQTFDLCATLGICEDSDDTDDVPIDLDVESRRQTSRSTSGSTWTAIRSAERASPKASPSGTSISMPSSTPRSTPEPDGVVLTTDAERRSRTPTQGAMDGWAVPLPSPASAASRSPSPLRRRRRCAPHLRSPATGGRLTDVDVIGDVCGVNVVALGSTTSDCGASSPPADGANGDDGLGDVAGTLDLCGTEVVVLARSSTKCGRAPDGPVDSGSDSTLAAAGRVATCGLGVVAFGSSDTICAADAQPDAAGPAPIDPALPGIGDPGGPTHRGRTRVPAVARATGRRTVGARSRPLRQATSAPVTAVLLRSVRSPLTGRSLFVILWSAVALVVAGAGLHVARRLRPHD